MQAIDRPIPIHHSVMNAIKAYIVENNLQPGDPLIPETELAKTLGVGRNSVREAIKALESLGILETRRGIGVFIQSFSFDPILDNLPFARMQDLKELSDLLEIRRVLEAAMIAKVIAIIDDTALNDLKEILARMREKAQNGSPFSQEDREFHKKLLQLADNRISLKLLDMFWLLFSRTSLYTQLSDEFPQQTYQDHVAILEALQQRNVDEAQAALESHYRGIDQRLQLAKGENDVK